MLGQALEAARDLARQLLQRKGGTPGEEPSAEQNGSAAGAVATNGVATASRAATRDEVYRRLADLADTLERLEPHSPIPYLIKRAVELGAMPFPLLIRALIREQGVLSELNRELGIKEEAEASSSG